MRRIGDKRIRFPFPVSYPAALGIQLIRTFYGLMLQHGLTMAIIVLLRAACCDMLLVKGYYSSLLFCNRWAPSCSRYYVLFEGSTTRISIPGPVVFALVAAKPLNVVSDPP